MESTGRTFIFQWRVRRGDELEPSSTALDWDAVGGLIAAVLAVILHLLSVVEEQVLLVIMTSLLALLFFRDLREETAAEELTQSVANTERND